MPSETIQQLLRERASSDTVAVKYGDDAWTWREHLRDASARAAALLALVDRGRPVHIGVLMDNTPEFLNQMAAAGLGGYVLAGINSTRRGEALASRHPAGRLSGRGDRRRTPAAARRSRPRPRAGRRHVLR